MYRIAFFCIPAHGHTNPTLGVVRELTKRGHEIKYFSYRPFQKEIEAAGAEFIACDEKDAPVNYPEEDAARVGMDIGFSISLLVNTTLLLDEMICHTLLEWKPDLVVADSMAVWGKFAALKLGIPFLSSTTTFAFNRYSSRIMKQSLSQLFAMLFAMPGVNRDLKRLRKQGYPVKNLLSIIQNDNDTNTIVYTSKEFQPCSDTFSDRYAFVGPSIRESHTAVLGQPADPMAKQKGQIRVYISMGTVNNRLPEFYNNCISALADTDYEVIMSVGETTDQKQLGTIPANFTIAKQVDQVAVLQETDVFLSHCGMNSVNESLYYAVPLVMNPLTPEQGGVANRVAELNAGILLPDSSVEAIRNSIHRVLKDPKYRENAAKIAADFHKTGGAEAAADAILAAIQCPC